MFKGIKFLFKYTWKFNKMYIMYISALQIVNSIIPIISVIIPKNIINELMGQQRIGKLILYTAILVGTNLFGGILVTFLKGRSFTSKSIVFNKFETFITERLSLCDFEQLENPDFLDIKEKAHKFLYANGQGFGVVLDSFVNIFGKVLIFIGFSAVLMTLNFWIVFIFILLILLNAYVESKVRKNYVKWDMEKAPIERKTNYLINLVEDFSYGKEIRLYNLRNFLIKKVSDHLDISRAFYNKQVKTSSLSQYFSTLTTFLRDVISYGYLIKQIIIGNIGIGDFFMYTSTIALFSGAMNDVMESVMNIKQYGDQL